MVSVSSAMPFYITREGQRDSGVSGDDVIAEIQLLSELRHLRRDGGLAMNSGSSRLINPAG